MKSLASEAPYFSRQVQNTRRFFDPEWKSHAAGPGIHLVGGGCEWCTPNFLIDRRRFPFLAFEFVRQGSGLLQLGGDRHVLSAGCAYLFDASVPHRIESDASAPLVKFFFNFHGAGLGDLLRRLDLQPGRLWRTLDSERVAALLEEAIDHAVSGAAAGRIAAVKTLEHALAASAVLRADHAHPADPAHTTYLRARDHLLRHYPRLATVEQAAAECGVSASYLTRLFKRFGSETPHHTLMRLKMSQALLLLQEPSTQVKSVAFEIGFKSTAHFSRAFKAWHGYPPANTPRHRSPTVVASA
ncbi:MAG: helix-turn-helix transcriptional regulator [Verrucomicrobiales bacterium]|nr:helix-turn-helix transcriptional regulator [Verrucomicrobiales bacterium]